MRFRRGKKRIDSILMLCDVLFITVTFVLQTQLAFYNSTILSFHAAFLYSHELVLRIWYYKASPPFQADLSVSVGVTKGPGHRVWDPRAQIMRGKKKQKRTKKEESRQWFCTQKYHKILQPNPWTPTGAIEWALGPQHCEACILSTLILTLGLWISA